LLNKSFQLVKLAAARHPYAFLLLLATAERSTLACQPPWSPPKQPVDIRDIIRVPDGEKAPWGYKQYLPVMDGQLASAVAVFVPQTKPVHRRTQPSVRRRSNTN
jgi:hypothetical protein